ncbi:cutinase [Mycobacterium bourgelatii]|uniref:Cutinase n=1 Tax=Mycobacterium bourgelatii TaxID=1273442 RepID=A0A7I9YQC6_MYCBU|nr:cutinase [Mycobacterium bourgelatii]
MPTVPRSGYHHPVRAIVSRQSIVVLAAMFIAASLSVAAAVLPPGTPGGVGIAAAANCPDVEVVFARGRYESPGPGILGNAFINALRSRIGGKSMATYAVRYPADTEIDIGANDMSHHIQSVAANCPNTRLVLGGYSLGAAVTDVVLAVPMNVFKFDSPLPGGIDQHIAAVALFGNGSQWVGPITNFNPIYNDRTIELCHGADPVCNPADPNTWEQNWPQHLANAYVKDGMANQAADFVASKL